MCSRLRPWAYAGRFLTARNLRPPVTRALTPMPGPCGYSPGFAGTGWRWLVADDTTAASATEAGQGAAGGRWVEVAPERLARWVATFAERHGAAAQCHPPFPPLPAPAGGTWPAEPAELAGLIAAHAAVDRTVGVFLVRLGGFAAGVFTGSPPRLVSSKVGSRLVHGRSAAGGTSQHRFARRRENQATAAIAAAADTAVKVLVP